MAKKGDILEHPITGERIQFVRTGADTDGQELELEVWVKPRDTVAKGHKSPKNHIHPNQVELCTIISGTCSYRQNGVEYRARQGNTITIPPKTPHAWWNDGKDELHLKVRLQPAKNTEELLETFCGLGQQGRANPQTGRPNLLQMAVMLHEFDSELQLTGIPYAIPGPVVKALATIGKSFGYLPRCPYVYDTEGQPETCRYVLDTGKQCNRVIYEGQRFCPKHATAFRSGLAANDLEVYKVINAKFNNELTMFWTRANLYLLVHAGLFSVAVALLKRSMGLFETLIVLGMSLVGFSLGVLWLLVMRGSVYWIGEWRKQVVKLDKAVDRFGALATTESRETKAIWRPAYVTKYLPVIFSLAWLLLAASILLELLSK